MKDHHDHHHHIHHDHLSPQRCWWPSVRLHRSAPKALQLSIPSWSYQRWWWWYWGGCVGKPCEWHLRQFPNKGIPLEFPSCSSELESESEMSWNVKLVLMLNMSNFGKWKWNELKCEISFDSKHGQLWKVKWVWMLKIANFGKRKWNGLKYEISFVDKHWQFWKVKVKWVWMLNIGNSNALQGESSSSSFKYGSEFCPKIVGRNEELVGGQFDASREKVVQWKSVHQPSWHQPRADKLRSLPPSLINPLYGRQII